ncbi:zinc finger protein 135 [Anopheles maculipalpis]|uniref:zinc finger protein 135 n=1 Tax=Anopheles maculipalpis TaxID=1496333 RepID=UPI002159956D|nr:zinc finger protein 135 [Anopheles maculipalpis]
MCTKSLSCILCGQPNFPNIDALRVSLLKVTARPLKCPICGDELLGLDKLTIHLFGHSLLEDQQSDQSAPPIQTMANDEVTRANSNTTFASSSFKTLRKVRKKVTLETEVKHPSGVDGSQAGKVSPAFENSQYVSSNANHCSECDVAFRNAALLKMHREVFHDSSNIVPGTGRDGAFDKRFHCHICPKEFKMKGSLKIHMRVVHDAGSKKICLEPTAPRATTDTMMTASVSDQTTAREVSVDSRATLVPLPMINPQPNLALFQSKDLNASQLAPEAHIIQIIDPRQLAQVVYLPPNNTSQQVSLPSHTIVQDAGMSPQQGRDSFSLPSSPQQQQQQQQQQGHENAKQWECDVCRKSFTTKYFLKKHNRLHTGEMPYTCGICHKSFTFQQSYHKHLLYHSDEKPHVCSVCNRAFKELSTLHNHQRIHSGEKPFACETCGKCFRQRVSYLVHRRIHTGLMPYKCSGCDKSFRYKVSQRTHKCPASPPGTVMRKTGDLLQKLLQSSSILPESSCTPQQEDKETIFMTDDGPLCNPIGEPTEEDVKQTADYVNRTLDELVKGSYDKLDIGNATTSSLLYDHQLQSQQLYGDPGMANLLRPLSDQPQPQSSGGSEPNFPRIESLCLLSPSAFDGGQLEDLEGLKLDNGW